MDDGVRERIRENATEIVSILVTGIWLAAMVTDQSWWFAALLVGYVVVVPLVAILFDDETDRRERHDDRSSEDATADATTSDRAAADDRDALETLRDRYARGELTDEQFERKLERLLETETLEETSEWHGRRERDQGGEDGREPAFDRE
ncbi:SHOCT domain-containing protein [Natribaculum luteum]|uniref:SHOCT domain-containing protein n=1 Tax=Natribaculum luteum TaxID=1586232 RepID=A0ABD5NU48_9EURY|nr:SHOCT domain-containing protein [Natribaculum luteum]